MIVIEARLHPLGLSRGPRLCEVHVVNDGSGSRTRGNYDVRLYSRGDKPRLIRTARVEGWPRNDRPAWRLIQAAMEALG